MQPFTNSPSFLTASLGIFRVFSTNNGKFRCSLRLVGGARSLALTFLRENSLLTGEKYREFSQFAGQIRSSNAASIFVFCQISRFTGKLEQGAIRDFAIEEQRITRKVSSSRLNSVRGWKFPLPPTSGGWPKLDALTLSWLRGIFGIE